MKFRWGSIAEYLRGRPLVPPKPESRWEKIKAQSIAALEDPQPGDYWSDMFAPVMVVLEVTQGFVIFCDKTEKTDLHHWTWDLSQKSVLTIEEFRDRLCYQYNGDLKGKPWAECWPKAHLWAVAAAKELEKRA